VEQENTLGGAMEMTQFVSSQDSPQELHFPIMLKVITDDETKEYHLKKLYKLSKKWEEERKGELVFSVDRNVYRNGKLLAEEPNEEEKEWVIRKMKAPQRSWERWFVGQYFTEEQKSELGLTDSDIAGMGMK
jgi:hypothetical protein